MRLIAGGTDGDTHRPIRPMSSGDEWAGVIAATQHAEELTAPPEGMHWVQIEGLWALRPIAGDLERSVHLSGHRPRASLEPRALSGRLLARRSTLALTTTIMHAWFGPPVDVQGSLEQQTLEQPLLAAADSLSALSDSAGGSERPGNACRACALLRSATVGLTATVSPQWAQAVAVHAAPALTSATVGLTEAPGSPRASGRRGDGGPQFGLSLGVGAVSGDVNERF